MESSLQNSCPPFLTSAWVFTQPNFPSSQETIRVRVQHCPKPPFSRCCLVPQFLWYLHPQSQWMYATSVCLPLRLYSPNNFQHPDPCWCQAALPALRGEGASDLTLLPISCSRHWVGCYRGLHQCANPRDLTVPAQSLHHLFFNVLCNFFASKLHTSWDSVGCSLCSSEDWQGVPDGPGRTGLHSYLSHHCLLKSEHVFLCIKHCAG